MKNVFLFENFKSLQNNGYQKLIINNEFGNAIPLFGDNTLNDILKEFGYDNLEEADFLEKKKNN